MSDKPINLNDPACEPSLQDFERLRVGIEKSLREEDAMLAEKRRERTEGKQNPNPGLSFDKK